MNFTVPCSYKPAISYGNFLLITCPMTIIIHRISEAFRGKTHMVFVCPCQDVVDVHRTKMKANGRRTHPHFYLSTKFGFTREWCHIFRNLETRANLPQKMRSFPTGDVSSSLEVCISRTHIHISKLHDMWVSKRSCWSSRRILKIEFTKIN
jgi:hypothetical protein